MSETILSDFDNVLTACYCFKIRTIMEAISRKLGNSRSDVNRFQSCAVLKNGLIKCCHRIRQNNTFKRGTTEKST